MGDPSVKSLLGQTRLQMGQINGWQHVYVHMYTHTFTHTHTHMHAYIFKWHQSACRIDPPGDAHMSADITRSD